VFFVLVVFLWLETEARMGGTAGISDINKALVQGFGMVFLLFSGSPWWRKEDGQEDF
jgi:hypothetical protein